MNILPLISVIVPIYNGEKYIEKLIENLLNSTYKNLEVILIDDGSKDKSYEICKQYEKMYNPKIKVLKKENEGVSTARNLGLYYATGKYIAFVDQDDEVSPDMYEVMISRIIEDHSQMAICSTYRKRNDTKIVFEELLDEVYDNADIIDNLLLPLLFKGFNRYKKKGISIYPTIWKCVVLKELITKENMEFISFINYEDDLLMLIRLLLKAKRVSTLSDFLYYWNTNMGSETYKSRYIVDLALKQKELLKYLDGVLRENGVEDKVLKDYFYVMHSRNVLQLLDNLLVKKVENFFEKITEMRSNKSVRFIQEGKESIKAEKGYIKNSLILWLVKYKFLMIAYVMNMIINKIRYIVAKSPKLEVLERGIKKVK